MTEKKEVPKISKESAEAQVQSFLDFYEIVEDDLPEKVVASFQFSKKKLIRHVLSGRVEIEGLAVTHITKEKKTFSYGVLKGKHKVEMDKSKSGGNSSAQFALIGSITGWHPSTFEKLEGVDLSVVECLSELFLLA